jgi:tRNA threonylcarbamoyladenosine biosynthesis protein TsaE
MKKYITQNSLQTKKIAYELAKEVLAQGTKREAMVLALEGELGGGKTTFLQGFAKGLGVKEKILSPTFVILKKFKIPTSNIKPYLIAKQSRNRSGLHPSLHCSAMRQGAQLPVCTLNFEHFYHIDCYRIKNEKDLLRLGLKEIIADPKNIIAIEWSNYIRKILPKSKISIVFKVANKNKRSIIVRWMKKNA